MQFYSQNGLNRPIRLSEKTRQFAYDSLNRVYGLDTLKTPFIDLSGIENFERLTNLDKYDISIMEIAKNAPIRVCENERLSGAATLGDAIFHYLPTRYNDERLIFGVSHLTVHFESVLKEGVNGIERKVDSALEKFRGSEKERFLVSCKTCIDAFRLWHKRYLDELRGKKEHQKNYENLLRVPFEPARNFYEAVQSIWCTFAFLRLCGNWPGIGRIDLLLGEYLKNDLKSGALTIDEAREILAHFFIKGCEWINGQFVGSGDAQHYQNIVLAGVDEEGREVTNEVTYLVLDILEELGISDFPTTVRLNEDTDEKLLSRVAEVMRFGGGMLAVYNEELIIDALVKYGYELNEARNFANDGCWEVQIPGKTYFTYIPFDGLSLLQQKTLTAYNVGARFDNFEQLYAKYLVDLREKVAEILSGVINKTSYVVGEWRWMEQSPCSLVSLFELGCVEKGCSYNEGGPIYNVISPHIGGVADTVNSLFAIKKLVFDDKKITLDGLLKTLRNDWRGAEDLRQYALNRYEYYGNDSDEVDALMCRLLADFSDICKQFEGKSGYRFPAGVSTFGRQIAWAKDRMATAYGRRQGEVLSGNCSPTPGTDKLGATAIIKSYCKIDHSRLVSGSALDLKLLPSTVKGEGGIDALVALMRGFVLLGGFFMQPDVVDTGVLKDAQSNPEKYPTLSVRVSGWNARFVTLDKEWQDMVIEKNEKF